MNNDQYTYALSIAGFDPSGGAGVLADIKTFEGNGIIGLGVNSAITYQNDKEFDGLHWVPIEQIIEQLNPLLRRFPIEYIKIGLIESIDVLEKLITYLKLKIQHPKLIWDPILKATAGFVFHDDISKEKLKQLLSSIYLVTPNIPEAVTLSGKENHTDAAHWLASNCNVLLKGGHLTGGIAKDKLIIGSEVFTIESPMMEDMQKHGTGCVLSSAITAQLALGNTLEESCKISKKYITNYLRSTSGLLGMHYSVPKHI